MAIIRVEKQKNYTVMSNHHLQDGNLSLKAKGLLSMMLSLPEDWVYSVEGLVSLCKEGRDAVRSALAELEDAGVHGSWPGEGRAWPSCGRRNM